MKARYPVFFVIFFCSYFLVVYAEGLLFKSIMPNTDDDANLEYIELLNGGDDMLMLSGYSIKDKSEKIFAFGSDEMIGPGESKRFYRPQTKVILNNSDEELFLYDSGGSRIDSFSYLASTKNLAINTGYIVVTPPSPIIIEETGGTAAGAEAPPIAESTGSITLAGSGTTTDSGAIIKPPLEALNLIYLDSDSNDKVDVLEIEFNDTITGSLVLDKLKLYSNTGGLSINKIDTASGIFSGSSISGSILYLYLIEQDNLKPILHIDDSTSSDLRLKSYSGIGITDLTGIEIRPITLTTSFDGYKNVFRRRDSPELVSSGSNSVPSGAINSTGTISQSATSAIVPDISLALQIPSYLTNTGSGTYRCDRDHIECKGNFNIEESFSGVIDKSRFACSVEFGTGEISEACNPSTMTFGLGETQVRFRIFEKLRPENLKELILTIVNIPEVLNIPEPLIMIQSGLDPDLHCNKSECSINFNGEENIGSDLSSYQCLWDFGGGIFTDGSQYKCNPSYIRYARGSHIIKLKIYERGNESNSKETSITIHNDYVPSYPSETKVVIAENIFKIRLQGTIGSKNKKIDGNALSITSQDGCSVNLDLDNTYDIRGNRYSYLWDFGNDTKSDKRNPPSLKYLSGSYHIRVVGTDPAGTIKEDHFYVVCSMPIKEEKLKKEKIAENEEFLDAKEFKEFSKLFTEILNETQDEVDFEKVLDKLIDRTQKEMDFINNLKFSLQGRKSKNIHLKKDEISCMTKKTCNINLEIENKKLDGFRYFWDMGNGIAFTGSNPRSVSYVPGRYIAILDIKDENGENVFRKQLKIAVSKILPKKKTKKPKKPKKPKKQKPLTVSAKTYKEKPGSYMNLIEQEDIFASSLVILSLTGGIAYFSRRKDDLMKQG